MNGASSPEDRQIALLATYDEALSSGSTIDRDWSSGLNEADRRRFEDNQRCLRLLEELIPRQPAAAALTPRQLGRFHIVRELGRGGFGIVYLADDPVLGRQVALKVPRVDVLIDAQLRERFLREARAAGRLNHPNLVRVLDAGSADGLCYIVSDYCAGPTLAAWIEMHAPCGPMMAVRIVLSIARAVACIHSQGILHRDIKPSNILLEGMTERMALPSEFPFTPRLTDFGLARLAEADCNQTATGVILGTPTYMAPEQARGMNSEVVPASDVYSIGAILYELCTGRPPFAGSQTLELLTRLISEEIVPPRQLQPNVPRDLEAICLKCLQRAPEGRYQGANALAEDLQRVLEGRPTLARPVSLWKRSWSRARRQPWLTTAIALGMLMAFFAATAGIWMSYERASHQQALSHHQWIEEQQADEIARKTQEQEALEREYNYATGIRRAAVAWREERRGAADEVLNSLRPADRETDLREFTLRYLWRQGGRMTAVPANPGGLRFFERELLTATNGSIGRWDVETRTLHSVNTNTPSAGSMVFSVDGNRLTTFHRISDTLAHFYYWDSHSGQLLAELSLPASVHQLSMSESGQLVAFPATYPKGHRTITIWEPSTGKTRVVWERDMGFVEWTGMAVQFSPDGIHLAIGFHDFTEKGSNQGWVVQLLNHQTGEAGRPLLGHKEQILALAFSRDGSMLASGGIDRQAKVWNTHTGQERFSFHHRECPVSCLAFHPDGDSLAAGLGCPGVDVDDDSEYLALWDLTTGARKPSPLKGRMVNSLAFSEDGNRLAMACSDSWLRIADLTTTEENICLSAHVPHEAWGIAFAPDRPVFATSGDDHLAKLWDLQTNKETARCIGAPSLLTAVAFAPDRPLLATAGYDGVVRLWNPDTGEQYAALRDSRGAPRPVRSVTFSSNGELLASAGDEQRICIWNTATNELLFSLPGHTDKIHQVLFAPDGKTLFSGGTDEAIKRWQPTDGQCLQTLQEPADVCAMAHDPKKPRLAVGLASADIELRRSDTLELESVLVGHTQGVLCVAFSPDGKTLASGSLDRSVRLWHVATGQELLAFEDLPGQINGVAFSTDGSTLAATCHDGSVRLWSSKR